MKSPSRDIDSIVCYGEHACRSECRAMGCVKERRAQELARYPGYDASNVCGEDRHVWAFREVRCKCGQVSVSFEPDETFSIFFPRMKALEEALRREVRARYEDQKIYVADEKIDEHLQRRYPDLKET